MQTRGAEVLVVMPELDVAGGREMGKGEEGRSQRGRSQMWARGCSTAGATGRECLQVPTVGVAHQPSTRNLSQSLSNVGAKVP